MSSAPVTTHCLRGTNLAARTAGWHKLGGVGIRAKLSHEGYVGSTHYAALQGTTVADVASIAEASDRNTSTW